MDYTPEQLDEMRAVIAAADAIKAEQRGSYFDRAKAITRMECYTDLQDALADLRLNYGSHDDLTPHVNGIAKIMQALRDVVGMLDVPEVITIPMEPVQPSLPAPVEAPDDASGEEEQGDEA